VACLEIVMPEVRTNFDSQTYDDQRANIVHFVPKIASPEVRTNLNSKTYDDLRILAGGATNF